MARRGRGQRKKAVQLDCTFYRFPMLLILSNLRNWGGKRCEVRREEQRWLSHIKHWTLSVLAHALLSNQSPFFWNRRFADHSNELERDSRHWFIACVCFWVHFSAPFNSLCEQNTYLECQSFWFSFISLSFFCIKTPSISSIRISSCTYISSCYTLVSSCPYSHSKPVFSFSTFSCSFLVKHLFRMDPNECSSAPENCGTKHQRLGIYHKWRAKTKIRF